ncbi:MAG: AAA family ATPase [Oscillospiraceae bacterium]|nr:AAA family ATPase [Oscillospiraceae bacterium]
MQYLDSFTLASEKQETGYILSFDYKLDMKCYPKDVYPFKIFPQKGLHTLTFETITLLYGSNGSGKSTLLNVIAEKLELRRDAPFNRTPFHEEYLGFCRYDTSRGKPIPKGSRIVTSDDTFDFLLNVRTINEGQERRREELFEEYDRTKEESFTLRSLEDYEELKRHSEAKRKTKSAYVSRRMQQDLPTRSNGETAFAYFTSCIQENALYLLDEPENSLSASLQLRLAQFLEEAVRFYNCQLLISTHSPFLLALKGAKIYDLDASPVIPRKWTELETVRLYRDFFEGHRGEFSQ